MPVTVEVPEHGEVEFPDGLSNEQMESALRDRFPTKPKQVSEEEWRATAGPGGTYLPASGEERAAKDAQMLRAAGVQGEKLPAIFGAEGPAQSINAVMDLAGRAATGVANIPTRLSNAARSASDPDHPAHVPLLEANKPKVVIPQIEPEQMEGESKPVQVAAGVYNKLAEFGTGLTTPGQAFTVAAAPARIARYAFGGQIAANIPGTIQESASILRDPKATMMEKGGALVAAPGEAFMLRSIVKSAPLLPRAAKAAAESAGITTEKGVSDAVPIRSPETLSVGATPGSSAEVGQGVSQPEAPTQTQATEAPRAQEQPSLRLTDEEQSYLDAERGSIDAPIQVVEGPLKEGDPFAGQIATIDRQRGQVLINPQEFSAWLKDIPEAKRPLAVRSLLSEERIHLATDDNSANAYWNSLSRIERGIEQRRYTGNWTGTQGVTQTAIGHEALRFRLQQLARMTPREIAEASGPAKLGMQTITVLGNIVRSIRGAFGTKASKEGLAILDRIQGNLDMAHATASGQAPASLRKNRKDESQSEFILPNIKGKGTLSKPPTEPATTPRPELAPKLVTTGALEADAAKHLSETARPSFEAFSAAARTKYGSNLKPGQLRELWQEAVWKRLESASGQDLGQLRNQLGLGREFGDRTVADAPPETKGYQLEAQGEGGARGTARQLDEAGRQRQLAEQRYRNNVTARIGEKLIGEAETGKKAWNRKEITPQEVATWRESSEGAYWEVGPDEVKSPESLGRSLTEGAAMERTVTKKGVARKAPPYTVTKRLTAMLNKATGRVELVGTYRDENGVAKVVEPSKAIAGAARPHVNLQDALRRYRPIASVLLDEPTQNFHQSFESVRDYQDRFGTEAKELHEAAQRTGEEPAAATAPESDKGATLTLDKPLQDKEAGAVLLRIISEVGKFDNPGDVDDTLKGLREDAKTLPTTKLDWPAINGFAKIYDALKRKWPLLDHEQIMAQMEEELYANHTKAETFDDFVARAKESFAPEKRGLSGKGAQRAVEGTADQSGEPGGKELTMPIERRPPTDVRPENVPHGTIPDKKPAPPVPEGGITGASSAPAAIRKALRQARDVTISEADRIYAGVLSEFSRRENQDIIPARFDEISNAGNTIGLQAEMTMRLASNATSTAGMSLPKAILSKLTSKVNPFGRKQVLRSAMALADAHAVTAKYDITLLSPEAQKMFADRMATDARVAAAARIIKSNPAESARLLREATSDAYGLLINAKHLRASRGVYAFVDPARDAIPGLIKQVESGIAAAEGVLAGSKGLWRDARARRRATHEIKVLTSMAKDYQWAHDNWTDPDLRATALQARKEMDYRYDRESDYGVDLRYDTNHTPGRYEGDEYNDGTIFFPGQNVLGTSYRQPKTFHSYAEAASQGYLPATQDMASIIGHRSRQGEGKIGRGLWHEGLFNLTDNETGLQVVQKLVDKGGRKVVPSQDYRELNLGPGYEKAAVLAPYERLLKSLVGESAVAEFAPTRVALEVAQRLKHTILIGDFFHLGRLTYFGQSIAGLKRMAGYRSGIAALDFREADLPKAVRQGMVSQAAADWATAKIPVRDGTSSFMVSRKQLSERFIHEGLNVGKIQDALYKDLVGDMPGIGRWNRWLFDKYTRGLMMESAVHEFERLNKARPDIDHRILMRDIARDTNRFFGNLGSQGWFKSKTWRDIARLGFLAPQWVEGLIMKEATLPLRLLGLDVTSSGTMIQPRGNLPRLGTLGKGIGGGLLTMLVVTQALNLWTRHQPTWMNQEEGHKWDAWLPGGKDGFFFSPLSVFNELTHDLVRLYQTKPKAWDAMQQIGMNKLSPFGRAALVLATDRSPTGEYQTSSGGVFKKAAEQMAPTPISFGKLVREGAHAVAPGAVSPNAPGVVQRQVMQWGGLKAEPASSAEQQINRLAQRFVEASGKAHSGFRFEPTDDPSYAKMRSALRIGDTLTADKVLKQLLKSRTYDQIGKAMRLSAKRPFTGSKKAEAVFVQGLSSDQRGLYWKAQEDRQRDYESFLRLMLEQR